MFEKHHQTSLALLLFHTQDELNSDLMNLHNNICSCLNPSSQYSVFSLSRSLFVFSSIFSSFHANLRYFCVSISLLLDATSFGFISFIIENHFLSIYSFSHSFFLTIDDSLKYLPYFFDYVDYYIIFLFLVFIFTFKNNIFLSKFNARVSLA